MTRRTWMASATIALAAAAPGLAEAEEAEKTEPANRIVVEVSNLQSDDGTIRCSIFSKEDGFPKEVMKADKRTFVEPKSKKAACTFDGMSPGSYAIVVLHDLDNDRKLKTSFIGRPQEPWGVSNNVPARRFGPPKYEAAKFRYEGGKKSLNIKLHE